MATRLTWSLYGYNFRKEPMKSLPIHKFGIATLLLVITWIAVTLGGYLVGHARGLKAGAEERRLIEVVVATYYVGNLVVPMDPSDNSGPDYKPLIALIENVAEWDPEYTIEVFRPNKTLIISTNGQNHDFISDLLDVLESQHKKLKLFLIKDCAWRVEAISSRRWKLRPRIPNSIK